jgi:3-dehydroquinate synthase
LAANNHYKMKNVKIDLASGEYDVQVGEGLLEQVGSTLQALGFRQKAVIITNPWLRGLYGSRLKANLEEVGLETVLLEVPDGEEEKSLVRAGLLYDRLAEVQAERLSPILALGGGVIGDLGGFVAATYMRGLPLIQLPTTLLAMVDSSIGGKVAVNHGRLKNNIGAFYQPRRVMADVAVLRSLPVFEYENGLAECIKYGVIMDAGLFDLMERRLGEIKSGSVEVVEEVIFRCASIKAAVVEKDERDLGLRNILNFGHTAGHGLESVSDFKLSHGRAVALGMMTACKIAEKMGVFPHQGSARVQALISAAGLPVTLPSGITPEQVIAAMQHDKKKAENRLRFVLPRKIGEVFVQPEVDGILVREALEEQIG